MLDRILAPIKRKINNLILRSVILSVKDSAGRLQNVNVQTGADGEILGGLERVQNFGLTSKPLEGAQAVVLCIGGQGGNALVISVDDAKYRIVVDDGEVAVYNAFKSVIKLSKDGTIELGDGTSLNPLLDGVVTKQCLCSFTGAPHPEASTLVKAKKG